MKELGKRIFSFLCTDVQYGSDGDPISFNDIVAFYKNIRMLYDEVQFGRIKSNIDFRAHVDRIGDEFERMFHMYNTVAIYNCVQTHLSTTIIYHLNK